MATTIEQLLACCKQNPTDLLAWAGLADLATEEAYPAEALRVIRRGGIWMGTHQDWEREGPLLVDRVPLIAIWTQDIAPRTFHDPDEFRYYFHSTESLQDPDDIPASWCKLLGLYHEYPSHMIYFAEFQHAITWLHGLCIRVARKLRDRPRFS